MLRPHLYAIPPLFLLSALPVFCDEGGPPTLAIGRAAPDFCLLGIDGREQLLGHPIVGPSWEGFIVENVLSAAPQGAKGWFYRTSAGAEIDLLLEFGDGELWAIEVKRSLSNPKPGKGFQLACEDVKASKRLVVYPGQERYPINATTEAIPVAGLLASLRQS